MCLIGSLLLWHTDGLNTLHDEPVVTLLLALAANSSAEFPGGI